MTPIDDDMKDKILKSARVADESKRAGMPCHFCTEPSLWGIACDNGKVLDLCLTCSRLVFGFLAARLQGDRSLKVVAVVHPATES